MPRLPELNPINAAPAVREIMAEQERHFGFVLNTIKQMGYCPTIYEGQTALSKGIDEAGQIEGSLRSLIYMRVATLNGCPFWLDINASRGMQQGLTEEKISAVGDYTQSSYFSSREKLALTYADRITLSDQDVDGELFAKLQDEFSEPAAIVELTAIVAFENFRSKFNHALQVEANGICQVKLSL